VNIVLASGFLFPQRIGPIDYFRGVKDRLEKGGHQVLAPPVPPLASCKARAEQLAKAIDAKFGSNPVHIIAHSMGGLDCRMMIGKNFCGLGEKGRVLSLTTLSTPHRGSPVADLLAGKGPDDLRRKLFDSLDRIGIDVGALTDLTSEVDDTLPDVARDFAQIHCRSYAASGRVDSRPTAALLLPTYLYVRDKDKSPQDNDGVVTVASATYGEFKGAWPCDHLQMVGYNLDSLFLLGKVTRSILGAVGLGTPEFDHLAKFDEIVAALQLIEGGRPN
jgi:triacylglycerol lipase